LYNEFVKKTLTPDFSQNSPYKKLRDDWPEFVRYKTSEEGEERVRRSQQNARQKVYHHKIGSGGYRSAIPKWQSVTSQFFCIPKITTEIFFANMPIFVECHIGKTPM
jgi:hypothetical protein